MKRFWNWARDEGPEGRTLQLFGVIAEESWWDDEVTPEQFREELEAGEGPVTVVVNSPGGDCIAASLMYDMLRDYAWDVTVRVVGLAASAASVVAMAGDRVVMAPTALMMIHNPATVAHGESREMERAIEMLGEVKESIVNAYQLKTGLSRERISRLMDDETWMNARKAVELGFCDEVAGDAPDAGAAYAFGSHAVARALAARIAADTPHARTQTEDAPSPETPTPDTPPGPVPRGRKVSDLLAGLADRRQFV